MESTLHNQSTTGIKRNLQRRTIDSNESKTSELIVDQIAMDATDQFLVHSSEACALTLKPAQGPVIVHAIVILQQSTQGKSTGFPESVRATYYPRVTEQQSLNDREPALIGTKD